MRTMLLAMLVLTLAGTVGCQDKNKAAAAKNGGVLDVTGAGPAPVAPREPEFAYAGPLTAAPTTATPAYYDTSVTQTPGGAGGAYTVKKGDTLFSIAKASYGNGNQWQKIAGANPGLSPATLKAGQKIVIP